MTAGVPAATRMTGSDVAGAIDTATRTPVPAASNPNHVHARPATDQVSRPPGAAAFDSALAASLAPPTQRLVTPTLDVMTEPLSPKVGWGVLHLFWKITPTTDAEAATSAVKSCIADDHQVITFATLGHKADVGTMVVGPDLWRLRRLQTELSHAGLLLVDSYVSFTEVSEYAKGAPEAMTRPRLYPGTMPPEGMRAVCFYPMSKRRGVGTDDANWFTLPFDDRNRLMHDHGKSGRTFAGRISQFVTGSTGVDDYEWGVTLFAHDPADLKEVVYTMRFDEASALYGEFGPFISGMVDAPEVVFGELTRSR